MQLASETTVIFSLFFWLVTKDFTKRTDYNGQTNCPYKSIGVLWHKSIIQKQQRQQHHIEKTTTGKDLSTP